MTNKYTYLIAYNYKGGTGTTHYTEPRRRIVTTTQLMGISNLLEALCGIENVSIYSFTLINKRRK